MTKQCFIKFLFIFFINYVFGVQKKLKYNKEKSWILRKEYANKIINYFIPGRFI